MSVALLEMAEIDKSFPGVHALRGVNLMLNAGEVLALLGENGAGKSTLIKVLSGAHRPDAGIIRIDGQAVRFDSPQRAQQAGIAVIYQEFNLIPTLSARENIFLGQESTIAGFISQRRESEQVREVLRRLGTQLNPEVPVRELTVAQQQLVEIARALIRQARILVMDEPTAPLTAHETDRLFNIIRDLKAQGIGIIYISHRLEEIDAVADRILVLRDGANAGGSLPANAPRTELIERMVGRPLRDEFPARSVTPGKPRLVVTGLNRGGVVRDVSFTIRAGEVLGLTGLIGAGRTETARLIFGADRRERGDIVLDGKRLAIRSPRDAIDAGIGLLPEDRKTQGLVLEHGVRDNFSLPNLRTYSRATVVRSGVEREAFTSAVKQLHIKVADARQPAQQLSGGNQQKIVLAKWLARNCDVLLFDEPTRGIDVGARYEFYCLINDLAEQGKAILLISSELPEVIGMADRILVMHQGRIAGEMKDARSATQARIMELAMGGAS
jgi:ribose transport system ATP-binding protein